MSKMIHTFWFGVLVLAVSGLPLGIIIPLAEAIGGKPLTGIVFLVYMVIWLRLIFVGWKETALAQHYGVRRSFIVLLLIGLIPPLPVVVPFFYLYLLGKAGEKFYRDRQHRSSAAAYVPARPPVSDFTIAQEFRELYMQYTFEAADEHIKTGRPVSPEVIINRAGAILMRKYHLSAQDMARIVEKYAALLMG